VSLDLATITPLLWGVVVVLHLIIINSNGRKPQP
jgi:hypothetical protein